MKEKCINATKKQGQKRTRGGRGQKLQLNGERSMTFCAFKLGFHQLICKDSLVFMQNLELPPSIILKERKLYESKHVAVECRCLKICDLLFFLVCSSILVLKERQFSPIQLELHLTQVNLYTRKDFESLGIGSLNEK